MSDPFLNSGYQVNYTTLTDGQANLNVNQLVIQSLSNNLPILTNGNKQLISSLIAESQVENLVNDLASKISNPLESNLNCNNFQITNASSISSSGSISGGSIIDTSLLNGYVKSSSGLLTSVSTIPSSDITGLPTFPSSQIVGINDVQTLTNKSMSGASNTFSAIPQSVITNLTTDLSALQTKTQNQSATSGNTTFSGTLTVPNFNVNGYVQNNVSGLLSSVSSIPYSDISGTPTLPSSAIVGVSDVQTLINKTMDGGFNTFSNISTSSITGLNTFINRTQNINATPGNTEFSGNVYPMVDGVGTSGTPLNEWANVYSDGDMISSNGGFKSKNINIGIVGDLNQITTSSGGLQITPLNNNFVNVSSTGTGFATLQSVNSGTIVQAGTSLSLVGGTNVGITASSGNINVTSSTGKINVSGTSLSPTTDQVMNDGDSTHRWLNVYTNDVQLTSSGSLVNSLSTLNNQVTDWGYEILSYGIRSQWFNGSIGCGACSFGEMAGTGRLYSAGGYSNVSCYSNDGGVTWTTSTTSMPANSMVSNWNSTSNLALGISQLGAIFTSVDGGINWVSTGSNIPFTISGASTQNIQWTGSVYLAIATTSPFIWSSSNGTTWTSIVTATRSVKQIIKCTASNIVTIGSTGPMYSTDGGTTFSVSSSSSNMFVGAYNPNTNQLVCSDGASTGSSIMYYSIDYGANFVTLSTFAIPAATYYLSATYDQISKKLLFCCIGPTSLGTYSIYQIDNIITQSATSNNNGKIQGSFIGPVTRGGNVSYVIGSSSIFGTYFILSFGATNSAYYARISNDMSVSGNLTHSNKPISLNPLYSINEYRIQTQINVPPRTVAFTAGTGKQVNVNTVNTSNSYFSVAPATGIITYLGPTSGYTYVCTLSWSGTVTTVQATAQSIYLYFVQNAIVQQAQAPGLLPLSSTTVITGGACQCFLTLNIGDTINIFGLSSVSATISFNSLVVNIRQTYN